MTDRSPGSRPGADPQKYLRLVQAAAAEFARLGFERANVNSIAGCADVGKGTVYLYFESKASLFRAVLAEMRRRLAAVQPAEPAPDPLTALRAFIRAYLLLADEGPDLFRCYTSALFGVNRDFQDVALAIFAWQQGVLDRLLGQVTGEFAAGSRETRAGLLAGNVLSAALLRGLRGRQDADTDVEERALLYGVLAEAMP